MKASEYFRRRARLAQIARDIKHICESAINYNTVFQANTAIVCPHEKRWARNAYMYEDDEAQGTPYGGLKLVHIRDMGDRDVTLLIPDRLRENREDLVWCLPVIREKFQKWYALADKFKGVTPNEKIRYMHRFQEGKVKTVLVMPSGEHTDEDAITACAWLRMVKQITCKFYIVRCTDDPLKGAKLINAVVGVDGSLMDEVDDDNPSGKEEKEA